MQKIQIAETTRHNAVTLISKPNSIIQKAQPTINPIIIKIMGQNFPKSKSGKKLLARNRKPKIINKLPPISPDLTSPLMLIVCLAVCSTSSTKSLKSGIVSSSVSNCKVKKSKWIKFPVQVYIQR
mgnify:CR=1 FL=1